MEPPVARQALATRTYAKAISMECEVVHTWARFSSEEGWSRHVRPTRHSPLWGSSRPQRWQGEESCRCGDREPSAEGRPHSARWPKLERVHRRRAALIAYDCLAGALTPNRSGTKGHGTRSLGANDPSRGAAALPVIYTTPVSPADGAGSRHPATIAAFAE